MTLGKNYRCKRYNLVTAPLSIDSFNMRRFSFNPAATVLLALAVIYGAIVGTGYDGEPALRGDAWYYYLTADSLLQDHDFDLANQLPGQPEQHSGEIALDRNGHFVPKHNIVLAILSLPLVALWGREGAVIFNLLQLLLCLHALNLWITTYSSPGAASVATFLVGVASFAPHYVYNYSQDILATAFLLGAFICLDRRSDRRIGLLLAGVSFGIACVAKFPYLVVLPALMFLLPAKPLRWVYFGVGFAGPVALLLGYNSAMFGHPLLTSYDRIAIFEAGAWHVATHRGDFSAAIFPRGLVGQLLDRRHGLLWTSPITVPSLVGLVYLVRIRWRLGAALGASILLLYGFFAAYRFWDTSHYGNRFLFPVIILSGLPLALLLEQTVQWWRGRTLQRPAPADSSPAATSNLSSQ
jgi:hypothetical protein